MSSHYYDKAVEHVSHELSKIGCYVGGRGSIKLVCPFHPDSDPSLSVNIRRDGVAPGVFYCFGCGASGNWNVLAKALNLEPMQKGLAKKLASTLVPIKKPKTYSELAAEYKPPLMLYDIDFTWKGLPPDVLKRFGAKLWIDPVLEEKRILFPVQVLGDIVGHFTLPVSKKTKKKSVNSPGVWVQSSLWPFDYVAEEFFDSRCVVIVEGGKDALRLLINGIPALANLGALTTWTSLKVDLLSYLGNVDTIVIAGDGDETGYKLAQKIKKDCGALYRCVWFKLPLVKDKKKEKKLDPANMPKRMVKKLKKLVRDINHE